MGAEALLDLLSRAATKVFKPAEPPNPVRSFLALAFLGVLVGAASIVILPHPLFHRSKFHGISLLLSPVAAGTVMSALGAILRKRGKQVVQIEIGHRAQHQRRSGSLLAPESAAFLTLRCERQRRERKKDARSVTALPYLYLCWDWEPSSLPSRIGCARFHRLKTRVVARSRSI